MEALTFATARYALRACISGERPLSIRSGAEFPLICCLFAVRAGRFVRRDGRTGRRRRPEAGVRLEGMGKYTCRHRFWGEFDLFSGDGNAADGFSVRRFVTGGARRATAVQDRNRRDENRPPVFGPIG